MKEYFAVLKQDVAKGRWFSRRSSMEEGDVKAPRAEAILRQILYANEWFRTEFGKAREEYMLPDCFEFPSSSPTFLVHAGVKGFSTEKLTWGSSAYAGGPSQGRSATSTTLVMPRVSFNGAVHLNASSPDGVTAAFLPAVTTGTSMRTLTATNSEPPTLHGYDFWCIWRPVVQREHSNICNSCSIGNHAGEPLFRLQSHWHL